MFKTQYVDNLAEFYAENKEHILKHYQDFADTCGDTRELSVNVPLFQHMIDLGHINIFTIWEDSDFLGYVFVTISPSLLFKGTVDAVIDHFYLTEVSRGKGYAKLVLHEIEEQLISDGVTHLALGLPYREAYDKFADKLGFTKQSCVYIKDLGEN